MKKFKKILSVLSAIAVMAVSSISASAYLIDTKNDVDFDNTFVYSSPKKYISNSPYYVYHKLLIDKTGNFWRGTFHSTGIAVKMKNGCKLPEDYKVEELTAYQKAVLKNNKRLSDIFGYINFTDIELTDNIYIISGFGYGDKAIDKGVLEYCEELMESGTVEFAEPLICGTLSSTYPISFIDKISGIDADKFEERDFLFKLSFENAEQAEGFDTGSVKGFEEMLYAMQVIDNIIYFQFKLNIDELDIGYMLSTLQNTKPVKEVDCSDYVWQDSFAGWISGVPEPYEMGDLNFDKKIDLLDVICLAKGLVSRSNMTKDQYIIADFDCNGKVELLDAIGIAKYIVKNKK